MINYISNLPRDLRSGGFSAMNVAAREALEKRFPVRYVGPIDPPMSFGRKALSKGMRLAGLPGEFALFSAPRLRKVAAAVEAGSDPAAEFDFFHGFTPWIATLPSRPYVAWSDCTFRSYMDIYHRRGDFSAEQLSRIENAEARWLNGASQVAFTSAWARDQAIADYRLDPAKTVNVGIFGEAERPEADIYKGAPQFAFVSTNFTAKGGPTVLEAFRQVRAAHPTATLVIVGEAPGQLHEPGVTTTGFLRKEDPEGNALLREILATSRAVVHPTLSDIAPLVLVEAAYFGCPAIASRRFAIPEIISHAETGLLLDRPDDPASVADAMLRLLRDDGYALMRQAAWKKSRRDHTREAFDTRLLAAAAAIGGPGPVEAPRKGRRPE